MNKFEVVTSNPYSAQIYIAGDIDVARNLCREFVMSGLCVTLTRTQFIYTNGLEDGVIVGLVNYPRFPKGSGEILVKARLLASFLMEKLFQSSALINATDTCEWITSMDLGKSQDVSQSE